MSLSAFFRKKSPWLLHYNSGSCLPADVEIILGDGQIKKIGELVEKHVGDKICNPHAYADVEGEVLSWNGHSAEIKPLVRVHKLKGPEKLIEIKTSTGVPIRLTPDHKVLVDKINGPEWVEAKEIKRGDFLYSPSKIKIRERSIGVVECFPPAYLAHLDATLKKKLKDRLIEKFGTLKKASGALGLNYARLSSPKKALSIAELRKISEFLNLNWDELKGGIIRISGKNFVHELAKKDFDKDLLRMLGLVASNGYITIHEEKGGHATYKIVFANKDRELVEDFVRLCKRWIPEKEIGAIEGENGVIIALVYSSFLAYVGRFLVHDERGKLDLRNIFRLPEDLIAAFLSGYFDGNGSVGFQRMGKNRMKISVKFTAREFSVAKQIHLLLKRLGIISHICSGLNQGSFGVGPLCDVSITTPTDILNFVSKVQIVHGEKLHSLKVAKHLVEKMEKVQFSWAPLECGKIIREIRQENRLKQGEIYNPALVSMIERGKRIQKHTLSKIVESLKSKTKSNDEKLLKLQLYSSQDFYLDPVIEVNEVLANEAWVYNLTVADTHCFIPEGAFVVKNCNGCDIELLAAITPRYDAERFGVVVKGSPRHADILVVTGPVTRQSRERLLRIYEQMPEPKIVVGLGACTMSNGIFDGCYGVSGPLDKHIPVDAYVPGCPPKPEAILHALLTALGGLK
jgi:Ni,Fe-hydrogenase III small subunit/intein/homing endonuclease